MAAAMLLRRSLRRPRGHRLRGRRRPCRARRRRRCAPPGCKASRSAAAHRRASLAETLAAYERGEINVLVNAQLLAEGWNAPRATICMHLAPTASRRVYQQRIGRVMRLHRRKEAGVVVDFADPAAPHSDRTVTLHSLLDADVYRPGALVTPKPPRRRQRWRRQARPVRARGRLAGAGDRRPGAPPRGDRRRLEDRRGRPPAARRAGALGRDGRAPRRPGRPAAAGRDAREGRGGRRASPSSPPAPPSASTAPCACAALGDLASRRPDINTIDRVVRLIEAAPTWASDRAQGARVLLLALAEGGLARLAVAAPRPGPGSWRRASRETQYRAATAAAPTQARDLLRALGGPRAASDHQVEAARSSCAAPRSCRWPPAPRCWPSRSATTVAVAPADRQGRATSARRGRGAGRRARVEPPGAEDQGEAPAGGASSAAAATPAASAAAAAANDAASAEAPEGAEEAVEVTADEPAAEATPAPRRGRRPPSRSKRRRRRRRKRRRAPRDVRGRGGQPSAGRSG